MVNTILEFMSFNITLVMTLDSSKNKHNNIDWFDLKA